MRILQTVAHYIPAYHFGGALHVAHSLSKALIAQGHQVHVCTTNLKNPRENLDVPLDAPVDVDGVRVFYEPTIISRYWGFSPSMARCIWKEVQWADVVLIHFHYQFASIVGGWISRWHKKPYIVFTHGSLNRFGVSARSTLRKRTYLDLFERGNFHNAFFVAYHSHEEMETSFQFGRCQVVPNGIDPAMLDRLPPRGSFRAQHLELKERIIYLYLGRLDAGKGLDLLLPAFRRLVNANPSAHLVLAGGNERGYETAIRQMISDLQLADRVTLTGLISGSDKLSALRDADVYVLPSRSEGLSIAMLEAMYSGLPVIVTDRVGLWRTIQTERCGWVVPLDEGRLGEALLEAASSPERVEMGKRGHSLIASRFTWDVIVRDLIAQIQTQLN